LAAAFRPFHQRLTKAQSGDPEMVETLALVFQHDEKAVLVAAVLALKAGAPTKAHIFTHRLDGWRI